MLLVILTRPAARKSKKNFHAHRAAGGARGAGNGPARNFRAFFRRGQSGAPSTDQAYTFTPTPAAVPEPSPVAPFAFAALGLLGLTLRARKSSKNIA